MSTPLRVKERKKKKGRALAGHPSICCQGPLRSRDCPGAGAQPPPGVSRLGRLELECHFQISSGSRDSPDDHPSARPDRNSCRQVEGMEMATQVKALGVQGAGGAGDSKLSAPGELAKLLQRLLENARETRSRKKAIKGFMIRKGPPFPCCPPPRGGHQWSPASRRAKPGSWLLAQQPVLLTGPRRHWARACGSQGNSGHPASSARTAEGFRHNVSRDPANSPGK